VLLADTKRESGKGGVFAALLDGQGRHRGDLARPPTARTRAGCRGADPDVVADGHRMPGLEKKTGCRPRISSGCDGRSLG